MGGGHGGGRGGERGGDEQGGGHQQELSLWSCHPVHPQHTYDLLVAHKSVREALLLLILFAVLLLQILFPPKKNWVEVLEYIICSVASLVQSATSAFQHKDFPFLPLRQNLEGTALSHLKTIYS